MAAPSTLTHRANVAKSSLKEKSTAIHPHTSTTLAATSEASARGAAIYSQSWLLTVYDWWVLGIVSTYAWACSVPHFTLPWFRNNVRRGRHLDIGVGTGYYLAMTDLTGVEVTLADLNQDALDTARRRLVIDGKVEKEEEIQCLLHDITRPLPVSCPKYDSISLYYLLHCLPGPVPAKTTIFSHLKHSLAPGGVISGASVLGRDVRHNLFGRLIMAFGNWNGMFDNWPDNAVEFDGALREHFEDVETVVRGVVFLWKAGRPRV
ncbi:MAG: hypothetical protein Q9219_001535 [cf. Caloplaca sp. 3 TL-2023]